MPADPMSIKNLLNELSSTGGGSLVKTVVKSEITSSAKMLVIGLGGMGCKTVNAAKGVYLDEFNDTGRIAFLAVDTDKDDMDDLNIQHPSQKGRLTLKEMFTVYDSSANNLLTDRPPIVEAWLSPNAPKEIITGDGAKQCRAVGRVMLCATPKYEALKSQISDKITELNVGANDMLQVIIVAGISGGTGSGTFIDVSYMVRMLLDELHNTRTVVSKMYGVFYTPDVQRSIPDIGGNPARWANLQRNGYAALKELDYFMNVGNQARGTKHVYSIRTLNGTYTSHQRLFERGHVYIISPTSTCYRCEDIIETTAVSLMELFRQGKTDGNAITQSLISELSNNTQLGNTWDSRTVGLIADNAAPEDKTGNKNTLHPVSMNYNFSAFGVRSIYFPRNEMVAYCANQAFLKIYEQWSQAFDYTQQQVYAAAASCGIGSPDDIFAFVKNQLQISADKFRIRPEDPNYPVKKMFRVEGTADTVNEAGEKVSNMINSITQELCDTAVNSLVNSIRARFEDQNFLGSSGPFAALVLLSGNKGQLNGFIQILESFANNIGLAINEKQQALDKAVNALRIGKQTLDSDRNVHSDEIETFIDLCQAYSDAFFEHSFFTKCMTYVIKGIHSKLLAFNHETFEIYVPIIKGVMEMLNTDATAFAESTLTEDGNTTIYSLNAFNLNAARLQNNLFATLFDGYIDDEKVEAVKQEFVASLFAPDRKEKWQKISTDPKALASEIRTIFSSLTKCLVSQMLEKFMVIVYGDKNAIISANNGNANVTINDINAIWNNTDLRVNALRSAARNIVAALTDSLMLKFEVETAINDKFGKKASVVLLNETPQLNAAIIDELTDKFGKEGFSAATMGDNVACEYKTSITMAMSKTFFPLAMVANMSNFAKEYFKSETNVATQAGRHLDEVTERWQDNLPEIFGVDTEEYYREYNRTELLVPEDMRARNQDKIMYEKIREAVDYGIKNKYIEYAGTSYRLLKLNDESPEFLAQIEDRLLKMKTTKPDAKWTDALAEIERDLNISKSEWVVLDAEINNIQLKSKQNENPNNDFDIKNIYRIVRADMRMVDLVLKTKKFYEDADFFYNMDNLAVLRRNAELFIKAHKIGAISYDEKRGWFCKYSDSQYEPPVLFFEDYMKKNEKLDIPFMHYLVFSAFVKNIIGNDIVIEGIEEQYIQVQRDRLEYKPWEQIIDDLRAAMNSEIIRIRDAKVRNEQLEPFYLNSNYKDYYCIPKKYRNADTLIENFNKFVEELEYWQVHLN